MYRNRYTTDGGALKRPNLKTWLFSTTISDENVIDFDWKRQCIIHISGNPRRRLHHQSTNHHAHWSSITRYPYVYGGVVYNSIQNGGVQFHVMPLCTYYDEDLTSNRCNIIYVKCPYKINNNNNNFSVGGLIKTVWLEW